MNNMGIVTTISAGNDRSEGLFYANGPAATRTGISVGSVDVTKLPAYFANVLNRPALPYLSALPLDLSSLPSNMLNVYFTSTDSTITNDACSALPDSTPNLANYVTVVQRGSCTFDQKMSNVAAKGGKVVLVYNSATASSSVPYLTPDGTGIVAVGSLRREEGLRLLGYYKQNARGLRIGFSANDKPTSVEDTISGGIMSYYSEFGPTFDMYGQPSFSAPGGNYLSTFPLSMGGLGVISGTSMACPHVGTFITSLATIAARSKLIALLFLFF
jgi:subtilisin family serine protease